MKTLVREAVKAIINFWGNWIIVGDQMPGKVGLGIG